MTVLSSTVTTPPYPRCIHCGKEVTPRQCAWRKENGEGLHADVHGLRCQFELDEGRLVEWLGMLNDSDPPKRAAEGKSRVRSNPESFGSVPAPDEG